MWQDHAAYPAKTKMRSLWNPKKRPRTRSNPACLPIVPVETYQKRSTGVPELIVEDEFPRPATTPASLAKLKPAFLHDGTGTVTAGNSTGLNDGAAYCVLMSEKEARERHILPLARIVAYSQVGIEPDIMGFGPVPAVKAVVRDS